MKKIIDSVHLKQFIKFVIVGAGNTAIDFSVYLVATRYGGLHYLVANIVSWTCAVCFSFTMNKFWTFRAIERGLALQQYIKFIIVSAVSLLLSLGLLHLFIDSLGIHDIMAKLMTIAISMLWNFFMNKFWTFSA